MSSFHPDSCSASKPTSHSRSYIEFNSIVSSLATARSDVSSNGILSERRAAASAMPPVRGSPMPPAVSPGPASAFSTRPPSAIEEKALNVRLGWAAGAGLEYAFAPHWSARLEYLYSQFDKRQRSLSLRRAIRLDDGFPVAPHRPQPQDRLAGHRRSVAEDRLTDPESDRWEIHGQTTYLPQGYPSFRAPYSGPNSLTPAPQAQATWSNSLFLNARLWDGGEVYYNPELLQGFGLNDTVGAGGLSERRGAEIQLPLPALQHLAAVPAPDLRLRRRAGRAGQRTTQLAGKVDVSRLTVQVGKFAVHRYFRRQRLRQGHPQGFHELVDVGAGRLRLFRRQGRPDLRRHRRAQSEAMGVARAAIS